MTTWPRAAGPQPTGPQPTAGGADPRTGNSAAWIPAKKARLRVGPAPVTAPRADEIVVANRAVAVNPIDWIIQDTGSLIFRWLQYPCVLGSDLAGDVVAVGSAVTRFAVGDRVLAHAVGADKARNSATEGSFQQRTVVLERMTCPIPDAMAYQDAAVLPLAVSTAACGLFQSDQLALTRPGPDRAPTGQTLLIWGGSTSVGCNAIQLAVAAGYEVLTTASPHNADYLQALGASRVFDRHSSGVVAELVAALAGTQVAGALAIGPGSAAACAEVINGCEGRRFVSMVTPPASFDTPPGGVGDLLRAIPRAVGAVASLAVRNRRRQIRTGSVFGTTLMNNHVCRAIYRDFLPAALAEGRYVASPPARIVGTGLGDIQPALDLARRGVSAEKFVVLL